MNNRTLQPTALQIKPALRIFVFFAVLAFAFSARATVLINDTFSDGNSNLQALPDSAHWYSGGPTPNMSVVNGALYFQDASAGKATAMAYFNPTELQIGQTLTLSFQYSFTQVANGDNNFMFGLYNSGGQQVDKNSLSFNNQIFNNYTGYAVSGVFGNDPSGPGRDHIEVRNGTGFNLLSIGTYTEGQEYIQSGADSPGQMYTASMQIARTAQGITISSVIGKTSFSQQYSTSLYTKFDTVGIFSNGNSGSFTLDNVHLDYSGVPEPSPTITMAFLSSIVFGRMARHRMLWSFGKLLKMKLLRKI